MSRFWQVLLVLGGLFAVGAGVWEVRTQLRMRWFGVRSAGVVLRHEITDFDDRPLYAPVVGFCDEHGAYREFRSKLSGTSRKPPLGTTVRVVHLPGRPETARLDTFGNKVAALAISFVVGIVFLATAVIFGPR